MRSSPQLADFAFAAIVTAEHVARKKPDPEVYDIALTRLGLAAAQCVAFEDSENGLRAALSAGLRTVVTSGCYTDDGDFTGCALLVADLDGAGRCRRSIWRHSIAC